MTTSEKEKRRYAIEEALKAAHDAISDAFDRQRAVTPLSDQDPAIGLQVAIALDALEDVKGHDALIKEAERASLPVPVVVMA